MGILCKLGLHRRWRVLETKEVVRKDTPVAQLLVTREEVQCIYCGKKWWQDQWHYSHYADIREERWVYKDGTKEPKCYCQRE